MTNYQQQQKLLIQQIKGDLEHKQNKATAVAMRKTKDEYDNPEEATLTSVVFIPSILGQQIAEKIIKPLKQIEPEHFYYPLESMHLTIKNIRTVSQPPLFSATDAQKTDKVFKEVVLRMSSFVFSL